MPGRVSAQTGVARRHFSVAIIGVVLVNPRWQAVTNTQMSRSTIGCKCPLFASCQQAPQATVRGEARSLDRRQAQAPPPPARATPARCGDLGASTPASQDQACRGPRRLRSRSTSIFIFLRWARSPWNTLDRLCSTRARKELGWIERRKDPTSLPPYICLQIPRHTCANRCRSAAYYSRFTIT